MMSFKKFTSRTFANGKRPQKNMDPLCINTFQVPNCELKSCDFVHGTPNLVTCGTDGKIHLHQLTTKYRRTDFKGGKQTRTCVAVTPETQKIFSGDTSGRILSTELSVRSDRIMFTPHSSCVNSIFFSADGTRFTTASNDGSAKIWDAPNCRFLTSLRAHKSWVTSSTFSPDGNVIVTSSCDKHVRLWDVRTSSSSQVFGPMKAPVTRATFHPDGSIIGAALENGSFSIIDTRNQQVIQTYEAHNSTITSLQIHPTGSFALTTGLDKKIRIWDLIEGQLFYTIGAHKAGITDGKWNEDGSQFLTCDQSGVLLQWQTNFDKLIKTIEVEQKGSDYAEQRLIDAMDVAPPAPRNRAPEPTPMEQIERPQPSMDIIETSLNRMLNQLDMLGKTMVMMDKRAGMLEDKLASLWENHEAAGKRNK